MCVKGDEVFDAVELKLAEHHCAVERLAVGSLVLSALVEHRHNNGNSARLTFNCANDTLKISEMLVGGHGNSGTPHLIGDAVIKGVTDDHDVKTSDRLLEKSLCLTRTEAGAINLYEIGFIGTSAFSEVVVNAISKSLATLHGDYAKLTIYFFLHFDSF